MISQVEIAKRTIRFVEHLPAGKDSTLVILKGHLLIEELLTELLIEKLQVNNPLNIIVGQNMMFAQKLNMCWALVQDEIVVVDVWPLLKELNGIRNKLAHSVEPHGIDEKITKFVSLVSSSRYYLMPERDDRELEFCLSWLYVMVGQCLDHIKNS